MTKSFLVFGSDTNNYNDNRKHIDNAHNLANKIQLLNLFDDINVYTPDFLKKDKSFWDKHETFINNNKRGYGYWLWKPYIIKKKLENLNDGDYILYLDSDCSFINYDEKQYLINFFDIVKENKILCVPWYGLPEVCFDKMDLIHKLDLQNNENALISYQNQGGAILIYVCKETREFVNNWYELGCDYHNIDDTPSTIPNISNFYEHRHDQSIFSLLLKKSNFHNNKITFNKCIYKR